MLDQTIRTCTTLVRDITGVSDARIGLARGRGFGDLAINCYHAARASGADPNALAADLADRLDGLREFRSAVAVRGYVNIVIEDLGLFRSALAAFPGTDRFGYARPPGATGRRVVIEYSSPNTNKPLHLGHLRNICIGEAVARLMEFAGRRVARTSLLNDRGIHICKSMAAYLAAGGGQSPQSAGMKGDHFVGGFYVKFDELLSAEVTDLVDGDREDPIDKLELFDRSPIGRSARDLLRRWEDGDERVLELWRRMTAWTVDGFAETYRRLGVGFDKMYRESDTYLQGRSVVSRGLREGIFRRRADGAIVADLPQDPQGDKVLIRADGTTVYMTQDIGTAIAKAEDFGDCDQLIVTGDEQRRHFVILFDLMKRLAYEWADNMEHIAYGMVNLPDGRMKSREGTVVDADNLLDDLASLARNEMVKRGAAEDDPDMIGRAETIAMAALKFYLLLARPETTMSFDPESALDFEGDTGPYVLYAYARIGRMARAATAEDTNGPADPDTLGADKERDLALELLWFRAALDDAAASRDPSLVARGLLSLARAYHSFNSEIPILRAEHLPRRRARLALSAEVAQALHLGLDLLGVAVVESM